MKIFIFAIAALIISLVLIFFTQYYISNTIEKVQTSLETLPTYPFSSEKASEKALRCLNDSLDLWQKRRFIICLMINRAEFEEIENELLNLNASVTSNDYGIFVSSLTALKENLIRLKKSESLSLDGIL